MAYILKEKSIDVIFHLAAQTHVDNSFGDSFEFTKYVGFSSIVLHYDLVTFRGN
jgi:dTDP-D-glucose 4,6-dehydratase